MSVPLLLPPFDTLSQSCVIVDTVCSSTHSESPYDVVLPVGHAEQVSDDVAPVAELYRPATQSVQVSAAEVDEYLPVPQGMQSINDPSEYFPARQFSQSELECPPLGLCLPAGHR